MATTKPTRSPRRAQPHSYKRRRLKQSDERLPVYEILHALNRDFEQVVTDFVRVQELGVFRHRDLASTFRVFMRELRAWVNMEFLDTLQPLEQEDWTHFSRLHDATLNKAKRFVAKRRKAAAKKRPRAKSEAV
jgi:hypothetical protein